MIPIVFPAMDMRDIKVDEVMSRNPLQIPGDMSIREAAELMRKRGVSTALVVRDGAPIGIVTDRDLVTKVLAEGIDPDTVRARDIMSSPVIMIPHDESISTAARVMSRRKIRKLPVVRDGEIIGLLSENDIVRIAPDLIALAREYAEMHRNGDYREEVKEYIAGKCEVCGQYSLRLVPYQGSLVCPECYDNLR